ncbi:hypothetical protein [Enterococcus aquimarinus]|uniref:Uncharacterized protein n=1 Tax=Enterococcus aquimarinus TaxID=328396 RepID=A0A1L8QST4_9ENTE|nr:hypothetical protein [Enterococcus aquimarinus]OJG10585.1 hypothetical protein RU93_GL002101 [Enterococcus aquimarinus]
MKYNIAEEIKIDGLIKAKISELHNEIHHSILSDRQKEMLRQELKEYQDLQHKNRMIRQVDLLG